jgi:hypothetical protein
MVDDRPEDIPPSPDSPRQRRAPPTIDLEATEVSGPADMGRETEPDHVEAEPDHVAEAPAAAAISPWLVAVLSGAVSAALVIGVGWMLGWPAVLPAGPAAPQVNAAVIDGLAARLASVESKAGKPATPAADPTAAARVETVEKSVVALRGEIAGLRAQSEKLAAGVNDLKSAPGTSSLSPDLSGINERIAQIERASRAQSAEIARDSSKPADDAPLRRVVVAALLDVSVRQGDPYAAALAAAKSLTGNADALKPLEDFAASGVPSAAILSRELLALVPKLSPPSPDNATTGSGLIDRLQAGASKLVRIERTDAVGNDRGAVVARATAAALRNDSAGARRELKTLVPAERAAAQGWLDRADARDAALAASRQFADDAMAALAKPAQ